MSSNIATAQENAARFDFTAEQWERIWSAVRKGCTQASRFDEARLRRAVNDYRSRRVSYIPPAKRERAWEQIDKLTGQLLRKMAVVDPHGRWGRWAVTVVKLGHPVRPSKFYSVFGVLKQWRAFASTMAQAARLEGDGEPHPRVLFFENVLDVWIDAGGRLGVSHPPGGGPPSGPTIRFLKAVAGPVMGKEAPSLEGCAAIIKRNASHLKQLLLSNKEIAADVTAARNGSAAHFTEPLQWRRGRKTVRNWRRAVGEPRRSA